MSIASNSAAVLAAAEESWGGLQKWFDEAPVEVRCLVSKGGAGRLPPPTVVRAQRNLLTGVANSDNYMCCDLQKGFGSAWITECVVMHTEYFRVHFLEAMAYSLLDTLHLVAVHAACVSLDGHGVLLTGDSGAGKSSLAYACARRGWTYTSDDASSLVRRDRGRTVLGNPRMFRFRTAAGGLFPEFSDRKESRRAKGKPTIEVPTASLPAIRTAPRTRADYVAFLNRRDGIAGQARILPVTREDAASRLYFAPWPRDLETRPERRAALERLLQAELFELRYRELDAAVEALERLIRGGSR